MVAAESVAPARLVVADAMVAADQALEEAIVAVSNFLKTKKPW